MNKVFLTGNLTKDPVSKSIISDYNNESKAVCEFSIAINGIKKKDGYTPTQFFNIIAFEKVASVVQDYCKQGDKITVIGKIQNSSWDKGDGTKGYAVRIQAQEVELLTIKKRDEEEELEQISKGNKLPKLPSNIYDISDNPNEKSKSIF